MEIATEKLAVDRIDALMAELATELQHWNGGRFMAMVYPTDNPAGRGMLLNVGSTAECQLNHAARMYQMCARRVDPSATEWSELQSPDDKLVQRFVLMGYRKDN